MSKLVILPEDVPYSEGIAKWGVAQIANILTRSPAGSGALLFRTLVEMTYEETGIYYGMYGLEYSRGGGGPSVQIQPPPSSRIRPQALGTPVGRTLSSNARGSTEHARRRLGRKSCPKGQYWSFKQKKCVKSKFR